MFSPIANRIRRRFAVCDDDDFRQANVEVSIVCISAFLPLWAGAGFFSMTTRAGATAEFAWHFFISGELLLIACAIIGPLIYIITRKYGKFTAPLSLRFPYSTGFSILIVLIWFIAGGIFVSKRASDLYHAQILDDGAMLGLSIVITVAALAILYLATLFRNSIDRLDPGKLMHDEQERFVKDYGNAQH